MARTTKSAAAASSSNGASVRIIESKGDSLVSTTSADIFVKVESVFVDLLAGNVEYEPLFGERSNVQFLIRMFKADNGLQARVSDFYRSMKFGDVVISLAPLPYIKPSEVHFSALELWSALKTVGGLSEMDALVVADQTIPALRQAGFNVSVPEKYVTRAVYGRSFVPTSALKADVAAQHCAALMDKVKFSAVGTNKYGKRVLSEILSIDLRHAGVRMMTQAAYGKVVDGLILGIRANLDLANEPVRQAVPEWLRGHPVVEEMSRNLTFITAAFHPLIGRDPSLGIDADDMRKYLDVLSASLKASTRYACVSLKSVLDEYRLTHGSDYNEEAAFAFVTHNVGYEAGVVATLPTIVNDEVTYLDPSDSRVAELLMAHDGGVFSLLEAANIAFRAREQVAMDSDLWKPEVDSGKVTVVGLADEFLKPELLIALAQSERVSIRGTSDVSGRTYYTTDGADASEISLPDFVFHIHNDGKRLPVSLRNRMLDRDFIITADAATAVILAKPFDAKKARRVSPQLPPASIFGARLLAVSSDIVQRLNQGVEYSLSVGQHVLQGTFFLKSIDSMQIGRSQGVLINPVNAQVTTAISTALYSSLEDCNDERRGLAYNSGIFHYILKMASRLSPTFREDVHQRLISQAIPGVAPEESAAMRATYNRSVFAIQVDLLALRIYLEAIGCTQAALVIAEIAEDRAMQLVMSQEGSDRRKGS